ncbi:pyridoxamine 5'-phosphate oxidase family protein [Breznakiella homolactica]|uniref:Pyridoxamine 5'-phosphate oxidase family protein n=1 Tax=Breznakiella homolactica TaxID=2798577 RepID=A0A7T7XM16_9SPIR|nr:pyridoxamine 5'-phosphate oxidase family protein [Breznakiella homolactica]QQO08815.1 pyridoxamine 5'-phosphate oxidase family protein [Breznakiella homolactica]
MKPQEQFVAELFEGQNLSFIGSVDGDGFPQIRAMLRPRKREGVKIIYFSTNTPTNKIRHFRENPKACVYFCDPRGFRGALLTGTMEVLETPEFKELLWHEGDELYYPGGITDPNYCVLRFTAQKGRIYGNLQSEDFTVDYGE